MLHIVWNAAGDKSWSPSGGRAEGHQLPITCSLFVEELVWGGGIGDMSRGAVWGKEC